MSTPTKLLIGVSGFAETVHRPSGIEEVLWSTFEQVPNIITVRYVWGDSFCGINRQLERIFKKWPNLEVSIVAYSYGCSTIVPVINSLSHSVKLENVFLIDPVWRPHIKFPSIFSIFGIGTLTITKKVRNVFIWRQNNTFVRGCKIVVKYATTKQDTMLNLRHTTIDSSSVVHETIIREMKK